LRAQAVINGGGAEREKVSREMVQVAADSLGEMHRKPEKTLQHLNYV
jgi:hypothetical protein